ncbi:MAG: amidohydrolase [Clostridia bacterium]|nr:amidohydrolase [Clostridia bacterium]
MIVDFHTHCFPDRIAERAVSQLAVASGNATPAFDGTAQGLLNLVHSKGVDIAVVLGIATNVKQQKNVNDFLIELNKRDDVVSFGSVHPDAEDAIDELYRIKEAGLKGIKLHPDYQSFFVDDDRMFRIYETVNKLGLLLTFHAGVDIGVPDPVHCTPQRLKNILPMFDNTNIIAAHFGGYLLWDEVEELLVGEKNLYIDTSFCHTRMPPLWAKRIIEKHGADKILLGSDLPWSAPDKEMEFIKSLGLSDDVLADIFGNNAARLLGLE